MQKNSDNNETIRFLPKLLRVLPIVILILILSVTTYARNGYYHDEVTLWEDVNRKAPEKGRAFKALGYFYAMHGDFDRAIENFAEAINRRPLRPDLYIGLAESYQ